ncbi:DUF4214 domain-containing protein [Amorphus sp. 3PC139-8]|uniref:DUF4214 domain-containing protein n=1 Tax=Amorphus sp. 3PC139-8 TaxID=2735676 RepID=UPI00345C9BCF
MIEVYEGQIYSFSTKFNSGTRGYTYGVHVNTADGTARSGVDYSSLDDWIPSGNYPAVISRHTINVFSDDLIEGDEYFYVQNTDYRQDGSPFDENVYEYKIIDTTNKIVFADINGDGQVEDIEINFYNYNKYLNVIGESLVSAQEQKSELLEFIKNNSKEIEDLHLQSAMNILDFSEDVAMKLANFGKLPKGDFLSSMLNLSDIVADFADSSDRLSDLADEPNAINAMQSLISLTDAVTEFLLVKKAAKTIFGVDVVDSALKGANVFLDSIEINSKISEMEEIIRDFNENKIPELDKNIDSYNESISNILSAIDDGDDVEFEGYAVSYPKAGIISSEDRGVGDVKAVYKEELTEGLNVWTGSNDPELFNIDGGGAHFIDARGGFDIVDIDISAMDTAISYDYENDYAILSVGEDPSFVSASGVERIEFADGVLAFDIDGVAGQAYRLYKAAFDRKPDSAGLGFWVEQLDHARVSLDETAGYFLSSEEFSQNFGSEDSLSDDDFLSLLYNNVLDRDPDQAGFDFWSEAFGEGISRSEVLKYFSESSENKENVAAAIDDGIWYV